MSGLVGMASRAERRSGRTPHPLLALRDVACGDESRGRGVHPLRLSAWPLTQPALTALLLLLLCSSLSPSLTPALAAQGLAAVQNPVETIILSPEPGERVLQDGVLVALSFVDSGAQLDPATIRIEVDGRDVTPEAELSAEVATWVPRVPLQPGPHRATVTARTRSGAVVGPVGWAFTVAPGFERSPAAALEPVSTSFTRLQGSVTFEGSGRSISGPGADLLQDEKQVPRLWVNAGGLISGSWRYNARVHVSGYESETRQPVNRFRFDIRSNHLNAGLGDVNPVLHDLMLAGARVRGIEADLRAGPARLTVVKGATKRAIPGLIDAATPNTVLRAGTWGQELLAVRPALVVGDNVQVGASFLRVKDDTTSIDDLRLTSGPGGASRRVNPSPKDNLVVGSDVTVRLLSSRLLLQYQSAFSLLANDITGGPITGAQLDSIMDAAGYDPLDIDPADFEDFFIVNQSMIPLDPRGMTSLAQLASASFRAGSNIVTAEWRSIGGSYYSLAYPALLRDRRGIRIRDSFTALRGALAVTGGFETDHDNLDDVKSTTTTNTGVFANASWQRAPRALALVGSVRRNQRENDLQRGANGALSESTTALSLGAGIPITEYRGFHHRANLNLTAIGRDDPSNPTVESKDRYFLVGLEGETDGRESRYHVMYGLNATELVNVEDSKTDFHRLVGNFRYLVAPRWTATLDGTYTTAQSDTEGAVSPFALRYSRRELLLGGQFEWTAASFVTLTTGIVSYADQLVPTRDTRELVARLTVHRSF